MREEDLKHILSIVVDIYSSTAQKLLLFDSTLQYVYDPCKLLNEVSMRDCWEKLFNRFSAVDIEEEPHSTGVFGSAELSYLKGYQRPIHDILFTTLNFQESFSTKTHALYEINKLP